MRLFSRWRLACATQTFAPDSIGACVAAASPAASRTCAAAGRFRSAGGAA